MDGYFLDAGRSSRSVRRIPDSNANSHADPDAYTVTKSDSDRRVTQ